MAQSPDGSVEIARPFAHGCRHVVDFEFVKVEGRRTASPRRRSNVFRVDSVLLRSRKARPAWSDLCGKARRRPNSSEGEGVPRVGADIAVADRWEADDNEKAGRSGLRGWFLDAYRRDLTGASADGTFAVAAVDPVVLGRFSRVASRVLRVTGRAPRLLFHGTKQRYVESILREGLKVPDSDHYTPYIWSSPHPNVSSGYSDHGEIFACAAVDLSGLSPSVLEKVLPPRAAHIAPPRPPAAPQHRRGRQHRARRRPQQHQSPEVKERGVVCDDMGWAVVFGRADLVCPIARIPTATPHTPTPHLSLMNHNPRGPGGAEATLRVVASACVTAHSHDIAVARRLVAKERTRGRAWRRWVKEDRAGVFGV